MTIRTRKVIVRRFLKALDAVVTASMLAEDLAGPSDPYAEYTDLDIAFNDSKLALIGAAARQLDMTFGEFMCWWHPASVAAEHIVPTASITAQQRAMVVYMFDGEEALLALSASGRRRTYGPMGTRALRRSPAFGCARNKRAA